MMQRQNDCDQSSFGRRLYLTSKVLGWGLVSKSQARSSTITAMHRLLEALYKTCRAENVTDTLDLLCPGVLLPSKFMLFTSHAYSADKRSKLRLRRLAEC